MENWDNEYPASSEYVHFYSAYVANVDKKNIINTLNSQMHEVYTLINTVPPEKAYFAYAPGKWSLKEVIGHMIETERVFSFRALAISRGDESALPNMDQEAYILGNNYNSRTLANLSNEYLAVRVSTLHLLTNMSAQMIAKKGNIAGNTITVRALAFIIAGHERHHINILRDKYLTD